MAVPSDEPPQHPGLDFIEKSSLSYFIPLATDFSLENHFRSAEGRNISSSFQSIPYRRSLFFDEAVDLYLVLRTPNVQETTLRSSLRRLNVSLEAQVVNSNAPERDSPPASEVIFSGSVEDTEEPFTIVEQSEASEGEDGEPGFIHAVWKLSVFLGRPRIRLQGPSAVFTAAASLKPAEISLSGGFKDGYLPSGVASGINLLEAFGDDPELRGIRPRLSALRVSRVAPITQQAKDLLQPLKGQKELSLRIYPAIHTRVRFSRPNTAPSTSSVIALLEVDFTPFFDHEIALDSIALSLPDGIVDDLTTSSTPGMELPLSCVAHDHVTFLYHLSPAVSELDIASTSAPATRDLTITISATALIEPGTCQPTLTMSWPTTVDFTLPVNPSFNPAMQPIQRSHRPSQLSISGNESLTAPAVARPDSLPSLGETTRAEMVIPDFGITVAFIAPPSSQKIYPGEEFSWTVSIVNRSPVSSTAPARKLALIAIPKRRRADSPGLRSTAGRPPSMSTVHQRKKSIAEAKGGKSQVISLADAVVDENIVHAMQRAGQVEGTEIVCLSADTRVGPLAPGSCHVVELQFVALTTGVVGVEAVRIVDLSSQEHVDIRELPYVFVESR